MLAKLDYKGLISCRTEIYLQSGAQASCLPVQGFRANLAPPELFHLHYLSSGALVLASLAQTGGRMPALPA